MATYTYQALNASGKTQKGTVEASSSEEAIQRIKSQGYFPTSVQAAKAKKGEKAKGEKADKAPAKKKKKKGGGFSIGGVSAKHLTLFTRQLSTLQDAGLPLLRSIQILESQQKPGLMKNILLGVCEEVEGGSSLSESMGKYPKAFDKLFVKMVNAGEIGGVLDVIAVIILTGIMVFIIPQFEEIFTDFEIELPALTQMLINTSRWVSGSGAGQKVPGWAIIIIGLPSIVIAYKLIKKTPPGRALFDILILWTPVMGNLVRKTVIARFTRTMGTLISAGVPILDYWADRGQLCVRESAPECA